MIVVLCILWLISIAAMIALGWAFADYLDSLDRDQW